MKELVFSFLILVISISQLFSQTVADFTHDTVCYGDTTTLTSTSTSTFTIQKIYWDIDSNGVFNDDSGQVVKWNFATYKSYNVGIQVISTNDTDVIYKRVITNPSPVADFNIDFKTQCVTANNFTFTNQSVIASPGTMTYFWDLDNGSTSTTAVDTTAFYFVADTYHITLAAISDMGCTDTIVRDIYVINQNVADFSVNDTIQCAGTDSFVLSNISLVCSGSLTAFSWDFNNDSIFGDSVGQGTVYAVFGTPGEYYIGLEIITTTGRDTVFKKLTVNASPTAGFNITSAVNQCQNGNSYDFANTSTTTTGTLTYLWNFGNGDTSTSANINNYEFFNYGKYNVTLYATAGGCTDSVVNALEVYPSPFVDFSINDSTQCLADTFFFTNNSFIFGVGLRHHWDFGDNSPILLATDTHYQYPAAGTYQVKLISISDSGCTDSTMKNVYVYTKSTADFIIDDSIKCNNEDSFTFTNTSINCGVLISTEWDFDNDGIFDATGQVVKHKYATTGTHVVGLRIITNSDTDFIAKNVYQYPVPNADFTINNNTQPLPANNFVFTNATTISPAEPITYFWDFDNGATATSQDTGYVFTAIDTYSIKLIATSVNGCIDSIIKDVYVISPLNAEFRFDTICLGDSTTFVDASMSGDPIVSYSWDMTNNGLFNDTFGTNVKYKFNTYGIHTVGLVVATATATDTQYYDVMVWNVPTADFTFNNVCQGNITTLTDASIPANTVDSIIKWEWDFDMDGTTDTTGQIATNSYALGGFNTTALVVTSKFGCVDSVKIDVYVNFNPVADFSVQNACKGDSTYFVNNSTVQTDSIINYLWDYGDGTDAIIRGNHYHYYSSTGGFTATLVALTDKGCRDTVSRFFTVFDPPTPILTFSGDTNLFEGQSVTITVGGGTFSNINWSSGETTASITATKTDTYTVVVEDNNGCRASVTTHVLVSPVTELEAVDVFTPNGDGINDFWTIKDLNAYRPVELKIFNRWGDEIYSTNNYNNDWDGKYEGETLSEGAYYYVLKTSQGETYKGTINILK